MPAPAAQTAAASLTFLQTLEAAGLGSAIALLGSFVLDWLKASRDGKKAKRDVLSQLTKEKLTSLQELIALIYAGQSKMYRCEASRAGHRQDATEVAWKQYFNDSQDLEGITLQWLKLSEKASPTPDGKDDLTTAVNALRNAVTKAANSAPISRPGLSPWEVSASHIDPMIKICRVHIKNCQTAIVELAGGNDNPPLLPIPEATTFLAKNLDVP